MNPLVAGSANGTNSTDLAPDRSATTSMEQSGISMISAPSVTDDSIEKSKNISITLPSNGIQSTRKELKVSWKKRLMREDLTTTSLCLLIVAEIIGTAILVFIGCLSCVGTMGFVPSIVRTSFSFGFAVMMAVQCFGHISGAHINPSITVTSLILGHKSLILSIIYIIAQCVGGVLGFGLLKAITPSDFQHAGDNVTSTLCMTIVADGLTCFHGIGAEVLSTGILSFFACGVWDLRNKMNTDTVPLRFGFCVGALCLVFIPYTGCALNPARAFGPAVWNCYWHQHWIYWVGPLLGAVIASTIYRSLYLPPADDIRDEA